MKKLKVLLTNLILISLCLTFLSSCGHSHKYDQENVDDKYLASTATCTEKAKYYKSCSCGEASTETFEHGDFDSTNHIGKLKWVSSESGTTLIQQYTCCGAYYSEDGTGIIDMSEDENEYLLQRISINTDNVKKTYYLGEELSTEGIVITAVLRDDSYKLEEKTINITTYNVESSFDSSTEGSYFVAIKVRYGTRTRSQIYTVKVLTSEEVASGEEYLAGLDVNMATTSTGYVNENTITFKKGDTFVKPRITSYKSVWFKNGEFSKSSSVLVKNITIDSSSVNTSVKGSYIITYSYTKDEKTVKSFILVIVTDPVVNVEVTEGTYSQPASIDGFDFSDWKFKLTEESGSVFEMNYDEDYITITGVNSYVEGEYTATITYTDDDGSVTTTQTVNVIEATTKLVVEFDVTAADPSGRVKLGETNYFHFTNGTACEAKGATIDNITFTNRTKFNGAGNSTSKNLEVYMPNSGQIVVYYGSSSSGTTRTIECCSSDGEVIGQASTMLTGDKAIFEVSESGTYYIYSTGSSLYFYGVVISYKEDGAVEPNPAAITSLEYVSGTTKYIQNGSKTGLSTLTFKATYDDNTSKLYTVLDDELVLTSLDNTKVGDQTLTATYDDSYSTKTCEITVNVTDVTLSNLEFVSGTTTQRASMGYLDTSDFKLRATYSDGSTKDLSFNDSSATYSLTFDCDEQTLGTKEATITYVDEALQTKEIKQNITIVKMSSNNSLYNPSYLSSNGYSDESTSLGFKLEDSPVCDESNKQANGFSFTKRIKLTKTTGISFTVKANAKVVVYALAGGSGRSLYLMDKDGKTYNDVNIEIDATTPNAYVFSVADAGTYTLKCTNSIYIELISIEYNQLVVDTTSSTVSSISVYSPIATDNEFSINQDAEFDSDDIILEVTYSDGAVSFVKLGSITYTKPSISTTVATSTPYSFDVTYEEKTITIKINVIAKTE